VIHCVEQTTKGNLVKVSVLGRAALSIGFALASTMALASDELPWAFNSKRADGYTIDLVSVTPEPGTPLIVGSTVDFKVTVKYANEIKPEAEVILVFQTDKGLAKGAGEKQVSQRVTAKSGELTLEDQVTIPKKAKQLYLFVPLRPDGLEVTDGEVVIRYPIKKR
jgi:hypothetical protein